MRYILLTALLASSIESWACSFPRGYELFNAPPSRATRNEHVSAPEITVGKIARGESGIGSMCADAGTLEIKVENHRRLMGYKFSITQGHIEDRIFPNEVITPRPGLNKLKFVWLDGAHDNQEPINITIKVVAVSASGAESKPSYFKVEHGGT